MSEPERPNPEQSAAELLDQVVRGERVIWLPPGALAASLLIPCLCIAAVPLGLLLTAPVLPLDDADAGLRRVLVPLGLAALLVGVGFVFQVCIVFGHGAFVRRLLWYVRTLLLLALLLGAAILLGWIRSPLPLAVVAALALVACHAILTSWSYAAVAAFFSLKRKYRLDARARAAGGGSR